jgi:hypothetical protein
MAPGSGVSNAFCQRAEHALEGLLMNLGNHHEVALQPIIRQQ